MFGSHVPLSPLTLIFFYFLFLYKGVAILSIGQKLLPLLSAYVDSICGTNTGKLLESQKGKIANYFYTVKYSYLLKLPVKSCLTLFTFLCHQILSTESQNVYNLVMKNMFFLCGSYPEPVDKKL